ncbi:MAG: hypothetical protein KH282_08980 [Clostridiales bacterium]|nr:hypothetical protein [Clostridiales bacterium]
MICKKRIAAVLAALLCLSLFTACSGTEDSKQTESQTAAPTEAQTEPFTQQTDEVPLKGVEFQSFTCTGENFCSTTSNGELTAPDGTKFEVHRTSVSETAATFTITVADANGETEIFNSAYYDYSDYYYYGPRLQAFSDGQLYFVLDDHLYRIAIETDETGVIINSDVYLVSDTYDGPVKAEKNRLILKGSNAYDRDGSGYGALDTMTGEFEAVVYNMRIDSALVHPAVSAEEAVQIAKKAIFDPEYSEDYLESLGEPDSYSLLPGYPQLMQSPDLVTSFSPDEIHEYFPVYAWHVQLEGAYIADVFVNAETGKISALQFEFLD